MAEWADTRETVHRWTQVVGKVRLALEPPVNHWWQIPLYVSARGLTTSLMHAAHRSLEIEFDFVDHVLALRTTDGEQRTVALEPRSVASFYDETMTSLAALGVEIDILARPVEVADATPFAADTDHAAYDGEAINRFWRGLVEVDRVLDVFRGRFVGKASPVHFFWGAFDMATTRFSGRTGATSPGRGSQLRRLGDARGLQPRGQQRRFLAGRQRRGIVLLLRLSRARRVRRAAGAARRRLLRLDPRRVHPSRTGRCARPTIPMRRCWRSCRPTYEAAATTGDWDRPSLDATLPKVAARMTEGSKKAIIAAFFANLGIAIAKFVGFLITSSAGLLAEAFHSLADTGNQGLLMLGGKRAARKPDAEHPFGYGRERYFWAFVVALVLFSLGGMFALYEGFSKLRHPHEVENLGVAIGILVFAICLETYSLRTAYREAKSAQGPRASRGGGTSAPRSRRNYPSSCSRTSAPRSVCSWPSSGCSSPTSPTSLAGTPSGRSPSAPSSSSSPSPSPSR